MDSILPSSSIVLGARDWLLASIVLAVVVMALAMWSYSVRSQLSGLRFVAMLLKSLAVICLAFCLLEPMQRSERPRAGANLMALVVDNSQSMTMRSPGQSRSRVDRLLGKLDTKSGWQSRLAQDFEMRRYAFDDRIRAVDDLETLGFDGQTSSLAAALETLQTRFGARPVAGAILFTDGLATDDLKILQTQGDYPFPIYPVVDGGEATLKDISLSSASFAVSSFELAPVTVETRLRAQGLAGEDIRVRLFDAEGNSLQDQEFACDSDTFEEKVRFQYQPAAAGLQFVTVRATLSREDRVDITSTSRVEATMANNLQRLAIDRGGGPFHILYVAGRANWEFKFIRRALEEDLEVDLVGLIRIAPKEPKFSFRDTKVDSTNPLMAGFSDDAETAEQYDEPVLKMFGAKLDDELDAKFPTTAEQLFRYDAIILDDVEAAFFTQQQQLLIREFVAMRGGGLMMLGGQESFLGGGYRDTPLGDVLPVYLRGSEDAVDKSQVARYRLSREGALEPWLRLRAEQSAESLRIQEMPDFLSWNVVTDSKPGAAVLAEITTASDKRPGLVTQRFGKGRSLALMVGDFWRWSMRRATPETDDLAQSWRQIARWLTNDVPRRFEVDITPPVAALGPHQITLTLRDESFKPLDNATISLNIVEPDGKHVAAAAAPDPQRLGVYVAEYWSQQDGGYMCDISAVTPDGQMLETRPIGWTAAPSAREFSRVETDTKLLEQLAKQSGGEVVALSDLESFAASLPTRKVPITEVRIEPLWHRPWLVLFAIGCLCAEWFLRRWKGLP
ncbi:MAG: glutamine amidotransferase [Pirellulaceae bacterium]